MFFFLKQILFFTKLSDFHKLVLSVFKTTFPKLKPKEITYMNFENFSVENFNQGQILEGNVLKKICIF